MHISCVYNRTLHIVYSQESYLVVSEQEHEIMDTIKSNMVCLNEIEMQMNDLNDRYSKSKQRIKEIKIAQIEQTKNKINKTFDSIKIALDIKKQSLLQTLKSIEIEQNDEDDAKETDFISHSFKKIMSEKKNLIDALNECDQMIKSSNNNNRRVRKEDIIHIGDESAKTFAAAQSELSDSTKKIKQIIDCNDACQINIDLNDSACNKILTEINNFGINFDEQYDSMQKEKHDNVPMDEDSDDLMQKEQRKNMQMSGDFFNAISEKIGKTQDIEGYKQLIGTLEKLLSLEKQKITKAYKYMIHAMEFALCNRGWECDEKEGCMPAMLVSDDPKIVRLLDGSCRHHSKKDQLYDPLTMFANTLLVYEAARKEH